MPLPISNLPGPPPANNLYRAFRLLRLVKKDLLGLIQGGFAEFGDIYRVEVLGRRQLLICNPQHIREVLLEKSDEFFKNIDYTDPRIGLARFLGSGLLTSNGDFWKRQRRLVAPALHVKRIAAYAQNMVDSTTRMLETWQDGKTVDIDLEMMHATLEIVAKSLFQTDVSGDAQRIAGAMGILQQMVDANNSAQAIIPAWMPTPLRFRVDRAVKNLDSIVYRLIEERKKSGEVRDTGDLLSMLLLARDDDDRPMTDRQARDEIVTMFLAGHETTANALNWTWVLLSENPEAEKKLHEELDLVLGGRLPTLEDIKKLPYTEMVIKESLRLYPPAFTYSRVAVKETEIGPYRIPEGTEVAVVAYATQRDSRFWKDPESFRPERFSPENEMQIPKFAWIPFGGGPRVCIGNAFAMMEACLMLAVIASRYSLRLVNPGPVKKNPRLTLRPGNGLPMILRKRN